MASKYHARKHTNSRAPLCGARGSKGGFHVTTLPATEWNALSEENRCTRCVAAMHKKFAPTKVSA
jgi:rubredoxin